MEYLGASSNGLPQRRPPDRHDHELLEINVVVGMLPPVKDVHHGHRQKIGPLAPDMPVKRDPFVCGGGLGRGQGDPQYRIGPHFRFVIRTVKINEFPIQLLLPEGVVTYNGLADDIVDVGDGPEDAFPPVSRLVPVPEFNGFVLPRGCSRRDDGPSGYPVVQYHIHFHSGVSTGIYNFSSDNLFYQWCRHLLSPRYFPREQRIVTSIFCTDFFSGAECNRSLSRITALPV